jgi:hypothetical protein
MITTEKQYIGTYKVVKIFRVSRRREVLKTNLTLSEAQRLTQSYSSSMASMVVFYKQFTADKYYI